MLIEAAKKKEEAKDQEIVKVLQKMKKQRQDSVSLYKKGGRQELINVEEAEIKSNRHFFTKTTQLKKKRKRYVKKL